MLGKLIKQSETGKCLVIGTIMADRLIIKQQKISGFRIDYIRLTSYKTVRFEGAFVSQIDGDADDPLL